MSALFLDFLKEAYNVVRLSGDQGITIGAALQVTDANIPGVINHRSPHKLSGTESNLLQALGKNRLAITLLQQIRRDPELRIEIPGDREQQIDRLLDQVLGSEPLDITPIFEIRVRSAPACQLLVTGKHPLGRPLPWKGVDRILVEIARAGREGIAQPLLSKNLSINTVEISRICLGLHAHGVIFPLYQQKVLKYGKRTSFFSRHIIQKVWCAARFRQSFPLPNHSHVAEYLSKDAVAEYLSKKGASPTEPAGQPTAKLGPRGAYLVNDECMGAHCISLIGAAGPRGISKEVLKETLFPLPESSPKSEGSASRYPQDKEYYWRIFERDFVDVFRGFISTDDDRFYFSESRFLMCQDTNPNGIFVIAEEEDMVVAGAATLPPGRAQPSMCAANYIAEDSRESLTVSMEQENSGIAPRPLHNNAVDALVPLDRQVYEFLAQHKDSGVTWNDFEVRFAGIGTLRFPLQTILNTIVSMEQVKQVKVHEGKQVVYKYFLQSSPGEETVLQYPRGARRRFVAREAHEIPLKTEPLLASSSVEQSSSKLAEKPDSSKGHSQPKLDTDNELVPGAEGMSLQQKVRLSEFILFMKAKRILGRNTLNREFARWQNRKDLMDAKILGRMLATLETQKIIRIHRAAPIMSRIKEGEPVSIITLFEITENSEEYEAFVRAELEIAEAKSLAKKKAAEQALEKIEERKKTKLLHLRPGSRRKWLQDLAVGYGLIRGKLARCRAFHLVLYDAVCTIRNGRQLSCDPAAVESDMMTNSDSAKINPSPSSIFELPFSLAEIVCSMSIQQFFGIIGYYNAPENFMIDSTNSQVQLCKLEPSVKERLMGSPNKAAAASLSSVLEIAKFLGILRQETSLKAGSNAWYLCSCLKFLEPISLFRYKVSEHLVQTREDIVEYWRLLETNRGRVPGESSVVVACQPTDGGEAPSAEADRDSRTVRLLKSLPSLTNHVDWLGTLDFRMGGLDSARCFSQITVNMLERIIQNALTSVQVDDDSVLSGPSPLRDHGGITIPIARLLSVAKGQEYKDLKPRTVIWYYVFRWEHWDPTQSLAFIASSLDEMVIALKTRVNGLVGEPLGVCHEILLCCLHLLIVAHQSACPKKESCMHAQVPFSYKWLAEKLDVREAQARRRIAAILRRNSFYGELESSLVPLMAKSLEQGETLFQVFWDQRVYMGVFAAMQRKRDSLFAIKSRVAKRKRPTAEIELNSFSSEEDESEADGDSKRRSLSSGWLPGDANRSKPESDTLFETILPSSATASCCRLVIRDVGDAFYTDAKCELIAELIKFAAGLDASDYGESDIVRKLKACRGTMYRSASRALFESGLLVTHDSHGPRSKPDLSRGVKENRGLGDEWNMFLHRHSMPTEMICHESRGVRDDEMRSIVSAYVRGQGHFRGGQGTDFRFCFSALPHEMEPNIIGMKDQKTQVAELFWKRVYHETSQRKCMFKMEDLMSLDTDSIQPALAVDADLALELAQHVTKAGAHGIFLHAIQTDVSPALLYSAIRHLDEQGSIHVLATTYGYLLLHHNRAVPFCVGAHSNLPLRPWYRGDGSLNHDVLNRLKAMILKKISRKPTISTATLLEWLASEPAMHPMFSLELLDIIKMEGSVRVSRVEEGLRCDFAGRRAPSKIVERVEAV